MGGFKDIRSRKDRPRAHRRNPMKMTRQQSADYEKRLWEMCKTCQFSPCQCRVTPISF